MFWRMNLAWGGAPSPPCAQLFEHGWINCDPHISLSLSRSPPPPLSRSVSHSLSHTLSLSLTHTHSLSPRTHSLNLAWAEAFPSLPARAGSRTVSPRKRRVQGSGFRVQGSGFRVQDSGCRVQDAGFKVQGSGFRVQGPGFRVQGSGFRVQGSKCRGEGSVSNCQTWPDVAEIFRTQKLPTSVKRRASLG